MIAGRQKTKQPHSKRDEYEILGFSLNAHSGLSLGYSLIYCESFGYSLADKLDAIRILNKKHQHAHCLILIALS